MNSGPDPTRLLFGFVPSKGRALIVAEVQGHGPILRRPRKIDGRPVVGKAGFDPVLNAADDFCQSQRASYSHSTMPGL